MFFLGHISINNITKMIEALEDFVEPCRLLKLRRGEVANPSGGRIPFQIWGLHNTYIRYKFARLTNLESVIL